MNKLEAFQAIILKKYNKSEKIKNPDWYFE